jgi:SNF2 family DNA or RNA helicase
LAANAEAVASLRPAAWTSPSTTARQVDGNTDRPSSSNSQRSESRNALPAALHFTPEQVQPVRDEYRDALVKNASLGAPLLNQWTLFPHQRKAILRALLMRRMILALDMGLGKTLIGCVWAKAFKASFERLKIFVICPVSLLKEWKRTAQEATGLAVQEGTGDTLDLQICSWAKVPTQVSMIADHFVVVCDEAHHIQSMSSARTKETLQLVSLERFVENEILWQCASHVNRKHVHFVEPRSPFSSDVLACFF